MLSFKMQGNISFILLQVLLVTGGYDGQNGLDSTEMARVKPTECCGGVYWREITSARLPFKMYEISLSSVDNRVLLFGEWIE